MALPAAFFGRILVLYVNLSPQPECLHSNAPLPLSWTSCLRCRSSASCVSGVDMPGSSYLEREESSSYREGSAVASVVRREEENQENENVCRLGRNRRTSALRQSTDRLRVSDAIEVASPLCSINGRKFRERARISQVIAKPASAIRHKGKQDGFVKRL
jgi:hypothetical protein